MPCQGARDTHSGGWSVTSCHHTKAQRDLVLGDGLVGAPTCQSSPLSSWGRTTRPWCGSCPVCPAHTRGENPRGAKPGTWGDPVHRLGSATHRRGCETRLQSHRTLQETEPRAVTLPGHPGPPAVHPRDTGHSPVLAALSLGWSQHGDRPHAWPCCHAVSDTG